MPTIGPTRDQVFLRSFGTPPPTIQSDRRTFSGIIGRPVNAPDIHADVEAAANAYPFYFGLNASIWKANFDVTNQGRRGSNAQQAVMLTGPANNPSRSQFVERYTAPIQLFASANTWQIPAGQASRGKRSAQPSLKIVSPFSASAPIPAKMPWDV